jgi:hypothetical protein
MNASVVVGAVVVILGLASWYLVSARRRRERQSVVTDQWLKDQDYPRDGDNPGRTKP